MRYALLSDIHSNLEALSAVLERLASERSAAGGIANVARTLGASAAPILAGPLLANPALVGVPIILAGGLKIVYDLLLFRGFRRIKPHDLTKPTEQNVGNGRPRQGH